MAEPHQVIVFPGWRDNPYLNLMYLATRARGVDVTYPVLLETAEAALHRAGPGSVFHMHWTAPVAQHARTEQLAWERVERFLRVLDEARSRGTRVVWTLHNTLPHELTYREPELALCRGLSARADVVHTMVPGTRELVAEDYAIDAESERVVPHPSYQGVYAARAGERARWREHLGVPADRPSVLFFGQMRPYKGLDVLLEALRRLDERGGELPTLLLAGSTPEGMEEEITSLLPSRLQTVRAHRFIPDSEVDAWFGAADLAVFPYRRILNSGSVHLAATMGVPAVLPGESHLRRALGQESWVRFYDPREPAESLADVLGEQGSYVADRTAMRQFSDRLAPWNVSQQLWSVLSSA